MCLKYHPLNLIETQDPRDNVGDLKTNEADTFQL